MSKYTNFYLIFQFNQNCTIFLNSVWPWNQMTQLPSGKSKYLKVKPKSKKPFKVILLLQTIFNAPNYQFDTIVKYWTTRCQHDNYIAAIQWNEIDSKFCCQHTKTFSPLTTIYTKKIWNKSHHQYDLRFEKEHTWTMASMCLSETRFPVCAHCKQRKMRKKIATHCSYIQREHFNRVWSISSTIIVIVVVALEFILPAVFVVMQRLFIINDSHKLLYIFILFIRINSSIFAPAFTKKKRC